MRKALTILCGLVSLLCASTATFAQFAKVRVATPAEWQAHDPSPIFGKKLGFFAEEGLDPQFIALQGSAAIYPQVASKAVEFAITNPDLMLVALDKGEPYPVKAFFNYMREQVFEFTVLEDSPIKTLSDLKGKKLGVGALTWGNLPMSRVFLKDAGVEWMKDVQVVPVGIGPTAWRRLRVGDVDALNLYTGTNNQMAASGTAIRRLPMPDKFKRLFSNAIVANADTMKANPKLVEGFGRAWAKSYFACRENPESCMRSYWDYNPAARPPADKEAETIARNVSLFLAGYHTFIAGAKEDRWGDYDPAIWRDLADLMYEGGQVSSKSLPVEQVYTREFLTGINNWNRAEIAARAKAAQ
ncbi:NitT/TauT family transport system substrate-binding protein [Bradyrhizobium sp. AZCC 2262]|uniref:ABC transporter substrate-binding protein n=1 Tax=Bradyrhizobium sp. AZCC 2262 TaxID=3117022 RepID=UPI002FF0746D